MLETFFLDSLVVNGLPVRLVADDSNLKVLHQEKVAFEMHLAHLTAAADVQN